MISAEHEIRSTPCDSEPVTTAVLSDSERMKEEIHSGELARCKEMVESGQWEVNRADEEGCFMLQWAALYSQPEIVRYKYDGAVRVI